MKTIIYIIFAITLLSCEKEVIKPEIIEKEVIVTIYKTDTIVKEKQVERIKPFHLKGEIQGVKIDTILDYGEFYKVKNTTNKVLMGYMQLNGGIDYRNEYTLSYNIPVGWYGFFVNNGNRFNFTSSKFLWD